MSTAVHSCEQSLCTHRGFLKAAALALCIAVAAGAPHPAAAQEARFPARAIRFIVPYLPGGTTDLVARTVGARVADKLGQPVVIENKPGAGGNIGMDAVAKAAPDGYTIGFGAISTNALNPHVYKSMPFDPRKDFAGISLLGNSTIVLTVANAVPARNVAEFVAYARQKPGLPYGTAGAGTSMHLAAAMFEQMTDVQLTHVPYKGSAPAITDMLGGSLPAMFDNLPASLPHIQAGKMRALAVAGKARSPTLPDVPTMAEAGVKGYEIEPWFGVYGPAGMAPAVVKVLNSAFVDALSEPAVKDRLGQAGFSPRGSTAESLDALSRSEYERLGKVAKAAKISLD